MATYRRTVLRQLSLANNAYVNAEITIYEADPTTGQRTATFASVYDAPVGGNVVSQPYSLDSAGKAATPLYIEVPVVIVFDTEELGTHTSGAIYPQSGVMRSDYAAGEVYLPGDIILDGLEGDNTGNLYVSTATFTATSWAFDKANNLQLVLDVSQVEVFAQAASASAGAASGSAGASAGSASAANDSAASAATSLTLVQALSGSVPTPVAINYLRQNAGATGFEYRTPAQVRADISAAEAVNNYLIATTDPTANNDDVDTAGLGTTFQPRSLWLNTSSNEFFICLSNATGAANWQSTTLTLDNLGTIATQDSDNVAITGGSITGVTITNVDGLGIVSLTASGATSVGDFVSLNSDETVSVVSSSSVAQAAGSAVDAGDNAVNARKKVVGVYDSTNNKVVVAWNDSSNNLKIEVGTVSGTTITFSGTITTLVSAGLASSADAEIVGVFHVAEGAVVLFYIGGSGTANAIAVDVSGASPSAGSAIEVVASADNGAEEMACCYDKSAERIVLVYGNTTGTIARVKTVAASGTTLTSAGSASNLTSPATAFDICYDEVNKKFVTVGDDSAGGGPTKFHVGQCSGNDVVLGDEITYDLGDSTDELLPRLVYDSVNNKIAVIGFDVGVEGYDKLYAAVGSISMFNITFGPQVEWDTGSGSLASSSMSCSFDADSGKIGIVIDSLDASDATSTQLLEARITGGVIGFDDDYLAIDAADENAVACAIGDGKLFYSPSNLECRVLQMAYENTNADSWVGVAQEAVADGQALNVYLPNRIDSGQSGLTAGLTYYLKDDGSLSTIDNGRKAGRAISATELLIEK